MGRPNDCDCHCDPCVDEPKVSCDFPLFLFDEDADPLGYTISNKAVGGVSVENLIVTKSSGGYDGYCYRVRLRWTQPTPPIRDFTSSGASVNPFHPTHQLVDVLTESPAAIVTFVRNDGPHFHATGQSQFLTELQCQANVRCVRVIESPKNTLGLIEVGTGSAACNQPESELAQVRCFVHPVIKQDDHVYAQNGFVLEKRDVFGPTPPPPGVSELICEYFNLVPNGFAARRFIPSNCWLKMSGRGRDQADGAWHPRYRSWSAHPKDFWATACLQTQDSFFDFEQPVLTRSGYFDFGFHKESPGTVILDPDPDITLPPVDRIFGQTPDLSKSGSAVDFGWCVGLCGTEAGTYEVELLVDNVCLNWSLFDWPEKCGILTVDELLDTIPVDWSESPPWQWTDTVPHTPLPLNWHIDDDKLLVDASEPYSLYPTYHLPEKFYARGSLYRVLTMPDRTSPDFCVTVEARIWNVADSEREWEMSKRAYRNSTPSPNEDRELNSWAGWMDSGIFIGSSARFGVRLNGATGKAMVTNIGSGSDYWVGARYYYGNPTDSACGYPAYTGLCYPSISSRANSFTLWPSNTWVAMVGDINEHGDDGSFLLDTVEREHTTGRKHFCDPSFTTHFLNGPTTFSKQNFYPIEEAPLYVPQSGDLLRMTVSRSPSTSHPCFGVKPQYNYPMRLNVWVNERPLVLKLQSGAVLSDFDFLWLDLIQEDEWLTDPEPLKVGVYAKSGGRFSEFKCWIQ